MYSTSLCCVREDWMWCNQIYNNITKVKYLLQMQTGEWRTNLAGSFESFGHSIKKFICQFVLFSPLIHCKKSQVHLFGITILQGSLEYLLDSILVYTNSESVSSGTAERNLKVVSFSIYLPWTPIFIFQIKICYPNIELLLLFSDVYCPQSPNEHERQLKRMKIHATQGEKFEQNMLQQGKTISLQKRLTWMDIFMD